MVVKDKIYGEFKIDSPAIAELIRSEPMQRLKKIAQYGIPTEFYHLVSYSRYDHCVGVMLMLRKFRASEEEQIAGLLHDVSHTAFSHLVDWFVGSGEREDFQDRQHKRFILRSEIAAILRKHKYSPKRIAEYHHFSLLEQPLPSLCADRLDYSLREFPKKISLQCLADLRVENSRFVFQTQEKALIFAKEYMKRQREHWGGNEAVTRYTILAKTIKYAMKKGIVRFADFWQYDEYILRKLRNAKDDNIQKNLSVLRKKSLAKIARDKNRLRKKFRYIDPEVITKDKPTSLSILNSSYHNLLKKEKARNAKGIPQPILHYLLF